MVFLFLGCLRYFNVSSENAITRLISELSRLPGIGEKTAMRLALYLVQRKGKQVRNLAQSLIDVADNVCLCSTCKNITEADPCTFCCDTRRDNALLCVVATPSDVMAIERGGAFRGLYHVLHGYLSPLEGIGPDDLHIDDLVARLSGEDTAITEVILATSIHVEGETTAMYLARRIKPFGIRVTRIASGLPAGGEIEYADRATIARALQGRCEL